MIMNFEQSPLPPYKYSSLEAGCIRLLVSSGAHESDGYVWSFRIARLDDEDVQFDALSYVWGSQTETYPMTLDSKCVHVHRNLYTALPYLLLHIRANGNRPIWIDALCINQADEEENIKQITLMHRIYSQAERVWAWLGISDKQDRIEEATKVLQSICEAGVEVESYDENDLPAVAKRVQESYGLSNIEPDVWSAVTHIVENPYHTRMWVSTTQAPSGQDITDRLSFVLDRARSRIG